MATNEIDWNLVEQNRAKLDAMIHNDSLNVVRHDVIERPTVHSDAYEKAFRETKARLEREEAERAAASFKRFTDADNAARSRGEVRRDDSDGVTYDQWGRAHGRALVEVVTPGGHVARTWVSTGVRNDASESSEGMGPGPKREWSSRKEEDYAAFQNGTAQAQWQAEQRARSERDFRGYESAPTAGRPAPALPSEGRGPEQQFSNAEDELRRARASQRPATMGGGNSFTALMLKRSRAMFEAS